MRFPATATAILRQINADNLPDSAAVQTATIGAYTAGTTTRPVTWATVATEPCRVVQRKVPAETQPQQELPVVRFEVSFRRAFRPLTTQRLVITSAEFGWVRTFAIDNEPGPFTDDVRTVAYCKALP